MAEHALLSASGAERWTKCTPSARYEEGFEDSDSPFALEGSIAHAIGERALAPVEDDKEPLRAEQITVRKEPMIKRMQEVHGKDWKDEMPAMYRHVQGYIEYVMAIAGERLIERRVDYSHLVPEGFGTSDGIILDKDTVHIVDLKYGKGIMKYADGEQMKLYAIGTFHDFGFMLDKVTKIVLHIYQPRLDHIDTHEMTLKDLSDFGRWIKPLAKLAWAGEGEYVAGDHCGFCKGRGPCKARAEANMKIAHEDFAEPLPHPNKLSPQDISYLLPQLKAMGKWATDVGDYALEQALAGVLFDNHKVVEGRSNRTWKDEEEVLAAMREEGLSDDQIYNSKLIGITEAEKLLGKTSAVFVDCAEKLPGKPTLVHESDKRLPIGKASAARDFADED